MKPIKFDEANIVYGKEDKGHIPLPALKFDTPKGQVISCWGLTFRERIKILFTGKMWVFMITNNKSLNPFFLTTQRKEVYGKPSDEWSWIKKLRAKK